MEAVNTETCNHSLGAPAGHERSTGTLHCRAEEDGEYGRVFRSYWRPTVAEIGELARGGYIELSVLGRGHPPVAVGVATAADAGEPID